MEATNFLLTAIWVVLCLAIAGTLLPGYVSGEDDPTEWFLKTAFGWLLLAAVLMVLSALTAWAIQGMFAY